MREKPALLTDAESLGRQLRDHLGDERYRGLTAEGASWSQEQSYEEALSVC